MMRAVRFEQNPIIRPGMLPGNDGENINGPSLIRAPDWLPDPLGRYYLYFAHHGGSYIRLAYADDLRGPWRVHEAGTLQLAQTPFHGHIASPDMHVDHERRQVRMYYHGCLRDAAGNWAGQRSALATSADGVQFTSNTGIIGPSYMRMLQWGGWWYCVAMPGQLMRSPDGMGAFEEGAQVFDLTDLGVERVRHVALLLRDATLRVFFSCVGDLPEHIQYADIELSGNWLGWRPSGPVSLLKPQMDYEGAACPLARSESGRAHSPVRQLRDPAIYEEGEGAYLLYSVAGERGIAIARLVE